MLHPFDRLPLQATQSGQCTSSACVGQFSSCSYGDVAAHFSNGSQPTGGVTGMITLQTVSPQDCEQAILGATCAQQYTFSVNSGFIQFLSASEDACVPGSAQQSIAYSTKGA